MGCEQLVPYEAALDAMLEVTPWVSVICQYPVYQFSGSTVYDNLCVHTHVQLLESSGNRLQPGQHSLNYRITFLSLPVQANDL